MFNVIWDLLTSVLEKSRLWRIIQPLLLLAAAWTACELFAYNLVRSEYQFEISLTAFLFGYISFRITVGLIAAALVVGVLCFMPTAGRGVRVLASVRTHWRETAYRGGAMMLIAATAAGVLLYAAPAKLSHIRVVFLSDPDNVSDATCDFETYAVSYLIYELNRRQTRWYFEIDTEEFGPDVLSPSEYADCSSGPYSVLCYAELYVKQQADGLPVIALTNSHIKPASLSVHRGTVSVISTADCHVYAPISTYDYIMHSLVRESLMIHLDLHAPGTRKRLLASDRETHGDILESLPQRPLVKSQILASRLDPDLEVVLFNKFGADYVSTCARLLTLDWLHEESVQSNLREVFHVDE